MKSKLSKTISLLALLATTGLALNGANHGAALSLLNDFNPGGTETTSVKWTDLSAANSTLTPYSGNGTISVTSPGYKASAGFYSFSGDYSFTMSSAASFDIQSVVLQIVMMPPEVPTSTLYDFNGGPVLSLNGIEYTGSFVNAFTYGDGIYDDGGAVAGYYQSIVWQWDLSSITDSISSISINTPILAHTSLVGAQLSFGNVFTAVPEPGTYAAILGGAGLIVLLVRRRKHSTAIAA